MPSFRLGILCSACLSIILASITTPNAALAACREDIFTVQDYSYRDAGEGKVEIGFTIRSAQARAIRMIDASFGFRDPLDGGLGTVRLMRDVTIAEGGSHAETVVQPAKEFERLLKVDRADVVPFVCVRGMVYADGVVEKF